MPFFNLTNHLDPKLIEIIDSNKILLANKTSLKQINYLKKKAHLVLEIHEGSIEDVLVDFRGRILLTNAPCNSILIQDHGKTKEIGKFYQCKLLFTREKC